MPEQNMRGWNTSNVTNMSSIFESASSFNQDIGGWDTSNVTDMSYMFSEASSFNQDLSKWNLLRIQDLTDIFIDSGMSKENYCKLFSGTSSAIWSAYKDNLSISYDCSN